MQQTLLDLSLVGPAVRSSSERLAADKSEERRPEMPPLPADDIALFLDVDGTLIDIAERPDGVVVPPSLRETLARLDARLDGALALVSGRSVDDLDRLFSPLRLRASGVHGAEMRFSTSGPIEATERFRMPEQAVDALEGIAARHMGALLENKAFSVALHYRAIPGSGPAIAQELDTFLRSPVGAGCRILPGHMVFDVKMAGFDKGEAVAAFAARPPFTGRRAVFIGDDITDLPAFERALASGGLAFSVTTPRPSLSGHFPSPESVRAWLADFAGRS